MTASPPARWSDRFRRRARPEGAPDAEDDDRRLIAGLRAGDEATFIELMDRYGATMIKVALMYVATRAQAEEVVQETWLAVLKGIRGFEGRSSLRTWIFRILVNRAKALASAEGRSVSFSALEPAEAGPAVAPERFLSGEGRWAAPPAGWPGDPETRALTSELQKEIRAAIDSLAHAQRAVVTLRDVHGFSAEEVCDMLELTPGNQRVLLHRGRSRVRALLERYLSGAQSPLSRERGP